MFPNVSRTLHASLLAATIALTVGASWPMHAALYAADAPAATTSAKAPASLGEAGEFAENIYDAALAKDWDTATKKVEALQKAYAQLQTDLAAPSAPQKKQLGKLKGPMAQVVAAVAAKQQHETMMNANWVTMIVAELTTDYHPTVPVDVIRLDYCGRELQIWSAAGDTKKLSRTAGFITAVWAKVRPGIEAKGGTAEAKKFSGLVANVEAAKTPEEFAKAASPLLDAVDELEKVYEK